MFPMRLNKGDKIGVISPSNPVTEELRDQFDKGIEFLENLGFPIVVGHHVFSNTLGYAASPQEKAADINRMFADTSIKAIICSQGGSTANACLPYLEWEVIQKNPKIFLGISDITVLINAIHHKTGMVTFHGNDLMWGFGRNPASYDQQEFLDRLIDAKIGPVNQNGRREAIRSGTAEGKLLGGNLPCLLKLAGTPYFPDFSDSILFVEAINISPEGCDHMFTQLKQMGVLDKVAGVIIGYIDGMDNANQVVMKMENVLVNITAEYSFPILKADDFGHNCPNTVLPVGGRVRIDSDKHSIEIIEECVK